MSGPPVKLAPQWRLSSLPVVAYLAAVAVVAALVAFFLRTDYRLTEEAAAQSSLNEAIILATRIETTLRRVQATTDLLADQFATGELPRQVKTEGDIDPDPHLVALNKGFPEVTSISVFDASGRIVAGSSPRPVTLSANSRPFFSEASRMTGRELRFSETLVNMVTGKPSLFAYEPILSPAGVFRGMVVLPLDLDYFTGLFQQIKTGDGGVVQLRRSDDSRLVLRWPEVASAINEPETGVPVFKAIQHGVMQGAEHLRGPVDGVERVSGFRKVTGFPFYVAVARSTATVFKEWRTTALFTSISGAIALAAIGLLLWSYGRKERARREVDARYRAVVDEQRDAISRFRPDTTLTFANATYRRYFQPPGTDVVGQKWLDRLSPEKRHSFEESVARQVAVPASSVRELWEKCVDGTVRCIQWADTPLLDDDGNLVEFQGVGRDITEQKRASEKLLESEQRLRLAQDAADQGWFDIDYEAGYATESAHIARILGREPRESTIRLSEWMESVHPDDRVPIAAKVARLASSDELPRFEHRRLAADGSWRWLLSVGRVVARSADGAPQRAIGITMDVTERHDADAYIHESEQRFRTMANSVAAIVWTSEGDGSPNYYNERALQFTGCTIEHLQSGGWLETIHPDDRDRCRKVNEAALAAREPFSMELRARRADGEYRWLRNDGAPRYDTTGKFLGFIGNCIDITDAKVAGLELQQHRENLEALVNQRTEQLLHAKAQAEAANVAKSAFLANMSHELRTPLNAITGMLHLLRREDMAPKHRERLTHIDRASRHLLEVINAVLELSKIDAGRLELVEAPLDLGSIAPSAVEMVAERVADKGLLVSVEQPVYFQRLLGDATRLREALLNYVGNAIKFTAAGAVTVRVGIVDETEDDVTVRFEVEDTGIGIDAADIPRLFRAFEQIDGSSTRRFGGTGLGLAITERLARMMGGEVGVESELGQGSTFWFTARLRRDRSAVEPVPPAPVADAADTLAVAHAGASVLLVEDDPINREVGLGLLEAVNVVVDTSVDGEDAVLKAGRQRYDVILMDLQLPKLSGLEATERIRRIPGRQDVPIIAMTASAFNEDRIGCLAAGMNDFIAKPVDPEVLYRVLLHWLSRAKAGDRA